MWCGLYPYPIFSPRSSFEIASSNVGVKTGDWQALTVRATIAMSTNDLPFLLISPCPFNALQV
jgi:hypothetical protein